MYFAIDFSCHQLHPTQKGRKIQPQLPVAGVDTLTAPPRRGLPVMDLEVGFFIAMDGDGSKLKPQGPQIGMD